MRKLPHSYSLAAKGIFPFNLLVSKEFLSEPKLPRDAALWANSLDESKSPSQARVDEVLAIFEEKKFASVGEMLRSYLMDDVRLVLRIAVSLADGFYSMLGVNYVASSKYSISSLAAAGSQTFLMRQKAVGQFSANNISIYG
jgi:hypothetical protein